jgi:Mn2+/Fe2+ NRAMP family transporter
MTTPLLKIRARFGPGLILAAAAVGTSHVIQSTRAGATWGLTLAALIVGICILKYPLFRFAADYAAITGQSLVSGYGRRGRWLVVVMFATSGIEAIAATAGVSLVSASILTWLLGLEINPAVGAVALLIATAGIIGIGRYRLLETLAGSLVVLFSLLTLVVTLTSLPGLLDEGHRLFRPFPLTRDNWSFAVAVSGWMPIGNTAAIMLAAWILAGMRQHPKPLEAVRFDFNLGYLASAVLAVCFLVIGAALMFGEAAAMPTAAAAYVTSFVSLYTQSIGDWARLPVSLAALAVMYSTLLAIVDGFPRLISEFGAELAPARTRPGLAERLYLPSMALIVLAVTGLLYLFFDAFTTFIDLVTITGFLAAPIVALANQMVMHSAEVPANLRPGSVLVRWNQLAVGLLTLATLGFLYLRFV